jgi:rhodanese-related sulfurtransferase
MQTQTQQTQNTGPKSPIVIDVREKDEFDAEHIEGSVHVPLSLFPSMAPGILNALSDRSLLLMCRSGNRARIARDQIPGLGFAEVQVTVFEGGIQAWKSSGKPTVARRKSHLPIMRQVQAIAGGSILAFSLLAYFVNPAFLFGAAFFGAGLFVAGTTGFCGMAEVLARMPWNQSNPTNREELCAVSPASGDCGKTH